MLWSEMVRHVNRTILKDKPYDLENYYWKNGDLTRKMVWKDDSTDSFAGTVLNATSVTALNDSSVSVNSSASILDQFKPKSDFVKQVVNVARDFEALPTPWLLLVIGVVGLLCILAGIFVLIKMKRRRRRGMVTLTFFQGLPPPVMRSDSDCGSDKELLPCGATAMQSHTVDL